MCIEDTQSGKYSVLICGDFTLRHTPSPKVIQRYNSLCHGMPSLQHSYTYTLSSPAFPTHTPSQSRPPFYLCSKKPFGSSWLFNGKNIFIDDMSPLVATFQVTASRFMIWGCWLFPLSSTDNPELVVLTMNSRKSHSLLPPFSQDNLHSFS